MQTQKNIDIFVEIIDNFGDMGFVGEFLYYFDKNFDKNFSFSIYTNQKEILKNFLNLQNIANIPKIHSVEQWQKAGDIAISFFHSPVKKGIYSLTLRVDYLSMNDTWLDNNFGEHIFSQKNFPIIELIPSPKNTGSGLLPAIPQKFSKNFFAEKYQLNINKKWFSIFCYGDTLTKLDLENIPKNIEICLFGTKNFKKTNQKNIFILPMMSFEEMYNFFQNSDYIITRGEVSFSQVLQMWKPFLWDIYHAIGGFPTEQSEEYLRFMNFSKNFEKLQKKMWHNNEYITLDEIIIWLKNEAKNFKKRKIKNFCEEVKNLLDKYENSI